MTIHVTFPVINAWITYQLYFSIMATLSTVCDTHVLYNISPEFCAAYNNEEVGQKLSQNEKYVYFYGKMVVPSLICCGLLFVEASVNLTYYKDCIFGFTVLMLYIGMLWVNVEFKLLLSGDQMKLSNTLFNDKH